MCIVGGVSRATVIAVLVVPVKYTASASLLPRSESGGGLLSAAMALAGGGLGNLNIPGLGGESAIQEAVLHSERIAFLIDGEFQLAAAWKTDKREEFLRAWHKALSTRTNREGLLTVGFQHRDPELAASMVSRLIEHLDTYNRVYRSTTGRRTRVFLEGRIQETQARMHALEDSLAAYQAENQGVAMSTDSESLVAAGASVIAARLRLKAEAEVLRRTLGAEAPALRTKELEIAALDEELAKLPALNSELGRLLRTLRVLETSYAFLSAQLEEARIEEARDTPTVDVLDPPAVPQEKSWPQRTLLVLGAFLGSFLIALLAAAALDAMNEVRRNEALRV